MSGYDILGIGSPILDYILYVDEAFLDQIPGKKGGMEPIDYETLQDIMGKTGHQPIVIPGGSGANTIKGLAQLGFKTALLGVIGQDASARQYLSFIKKANIVPLFQISELHTSEVLCLITPDGERTLRSFLGASQDIHLDQITPDLFKDVRLVHIEGYSLLQGVFPEKAMQLAKAVGAKISFDLASFELVEQFKERILTLLSLYVDIAFANEKEIKTLTGMGGQKGCQYLKDISETAVVMQSSEGCWVGHNTTMIHHPALEVQMMDSTGAGDLFASGFLAAYLSGKSLQECAAFGNTLGAAAVQVPGTEIPEDKWEQFKKEIGASSQ
jgi:sugar/nucleoside kinase (ribokinase family)